MRANLAALLLILVVVAGAAYRFSLLESHFAHFDDVGVADTIIVAQTRPPPLPPYLPAKVFPWAAPGLYWTYAPLPYVLTPFLIHDGQSYSAVKFWGRLPSLLFTLAAMVLLAFAARRLDRRAPWALGAIMAAILAFSREFTIMAAQMHPYAATAAAAAGILLLTLYDVERVGRPIGARFAISRGLLLVGACGLSYQMVLFLPGYFVTVGLAILLAENPRRWISTGWPLAGAAVISGIGVAAAYVLKIRYIRAVWWNIGPHGEFLFQPQHGFLETVTAAVRFVLVNGPITLQSLVSPAPEDSLVAVSVTAVVVVGLLAGLGFCLVSAWRSRRALEAQGGLGLYAVVTLAALLVFVLRGKLALSPTRHMVAYLPLVAALAAWGAWRAIGWVAERRPGRAGVIMTAAAAGLVVVLGAVYQSGFASFRHERLDPFNEAEILRLAHETHADAVVAYEFTKQLSLMPSLRRDFPVLEQEFSRPVDWARVRGGRLLFVSHGAYTEDVCRDVAAKLEANLKVETSGCSPDRVQTLIAKASPVVVDFSRRTVTGTNGLYVTVVDLQARPKGL